MIINFSLSESQIKKFQAWKKLLVKIYKDSFKDSFEFRFTPTGIGDVIIIKHKQSKKRLNITEYDKW